MEIVNAKTQTVSNYCKRIDCSWDFSVLFYLKCVKLLGNSQYTASLCRVAVVGYDMVGRRNLIGNGVH